MLGRMADLLVIAAVRDGFRFKTTRVPTRPLTPKEKTMAEQSTSDELTRVEDEEEETEILYKFRSQVARMYEQAGRRTLEGMLMSTYIPDSAR
jgi:uncharacterized tellurite resistance protein B-like protein